MMLPFYQNIQPPAHLDSSGTDNYINLCNRLSELEERTNLIESEHVHTAIQIKDMDNERIVSIIKREVVNWKKSIDHLDKIRHFVKGVFPKLVHVLSMDSGRLAKEMVKRARDISYLKAIQSEIRTRRLSTNPVNSEVAKNQFLAKFAGGCNPHVYRWLTKARDL